MATLYVHTRANGFKRWVCVERAGNRTDALAAIGRLQRQDDPTWARAEYLVSDSLHPADAEAPTVPALVKE